MPDPNNFIDRDGNPIECKSGKPKYTSKCLVCQNTVVIHCIECTLQLTGCRCTLDVRLKKELENPN